MKAKLFLTCAAIGTLLTGSALANIVISSEAPSEGVYKFQDVVPDRSPATLRFSNNPTTKWQSLGQGFSTIGAEDPLNLDSVSFLMMDYLSGVEGLTLRMDVYQGGSSSNARPMGDNATLIYTQDSDLPALLENDSYLTFNLDSNLELDQDSYFSVALSFVDQTPGTTNEGIGLATIASGSPPVSNTIGGNRFIWNGEFYSASTTNGFVMYVNTSAIPEASSMPLGVGLMALGLVVVARRRRKV